MEFKALLVAAIIFSANDRETREILHTTYHLTSTLAALLHKHHLASNEKMILQVFKLVCKKIKRQETKFPVTPSFVLTHSPDSI